MAVPPPSASDRIVIVRHGKSRRPYPRAWMPITTVGDRAQDVTWALATPIA